MKKLAILFFGKHFHKDYYNRINRIRVNIDYRYSIDNYREFIYNYFQSIFDEIDTYICTDKSPMLDQLILDYHPKKINIMEKHRNQKIISVIDLCLNSNIVYDTILITRFDLLFNKKFDTVNIDYSTINIVTQLERSAIDDNLYILPFDKLSLFKQIVVSHKSDNLHFIKDKVMKCFPSINYLYNESGKIVKNLSFYKIVRKK